jgi:hypothetical protein
MYCLKQCGHLAVKQKTLVIEKGGATWPKGHWQYSIFFSLP